MPIPGFNENGHLPEGIYECTVCEIENRFGKLQTSDRRVMLFKNLKSYIEELKSTNIGKYLIIDGSFTTEKNIPSDIDLLLVLKDDVDLAEPVPPYIYNPRSKRYLRKKYPFDFHFGFENHESSKNILDLFFKVKYSTLRKGFLKIIL